MIKQIEFYITPETNTNRKCFKKFSGKIISEKRCSRGKMDSS